MGEVILKVLVPKDRSKNGVLTVEVNQKDVAAFPVLARGSRGPGETEFLEHGNTPTGVYAGAAFKSTAGQDTAKYGPNGKLALTPVSGKALPALRYFKRTELLIHGGNLENRADSPWKGNLKPTWGCLRVANENVSKLKNILLSATLDDATQTCTSPQVWVNVQEGHTFDPSDDGLNQCSAAPYSVFGDHSSLQFQK